MSSQRILIYSPSSLRAVDQQSQAELLIRAGHEVYLLTWAPPGPLHENFSQLGAKTFSSHTVKGRSLFFFINQARYLRRFCKEHRIDVVFAHLQSNAVVAGMAKPFMRAKLYYFRHNSDYAELMPSRKNKILNRWANRLSPAIVAISGKVKEQLLKEGVSEKKIFRINYCYNFSQYRKNSLNNAAEIRTKYNSDLLLLMVARLDPLKRHILAFEVVKQLVAQGVHCKLLSIGDGPEREGLEKWIADNEMQNHIFLESFAPNTIDYFEACDLLIHPSYSEASSHVVKEAGMCNKTVVACTQVGDFDDYLSHLNNAFLVSKENPVEETVQLLAQYGSDKVKLAEMGQALHQKVVDTFSIEAVLQTYIKLLNQ
ncbi:MAG: glycosyltransferase family 4 protein [Bacteroidetes bacterium]|nr:glycosyltransferase family 4 protein [Bacteroidota bacterium]